MAGPSASLTLRIDNPIYANPIYQPQFIAIIDNIFVENFPDGYPALMLPDAAWLQGKIDAILPGFLTVLEVRFEEGAFLTTEPPVTGDVTWPGFAVTTATLTLKWNQMGYAGYETAYGDFIQQQVMQADTTEGLLDLAWFEEQYAGLPIDFMNLSYAEGAAPGDRIQLAFDWAPSGFENAPADIAVTVHLTALTAEASTSAAIAAARAAIEGALAAHEGLGQPTAQELLAVLPAGAYAVSVSPEGVIPDVEDPTWVLGTFEVTPYTAPVVPVDVPVSVKVLLLQNLQGDRDTARDVLEARYGDLARGQDGYTALELEEALRGAGITATVLRAMPDYAATPGHRLVLGEVEFVSATQTTDATVFDLARGTAQGRMQRADGTWVFELGHAGRILELASIGDAQALAQLVDVDGEYNNEFVRLALRVVAPARRPGGDVDEWLFSATRDGVVFYARVIVGDGVTRELRDVVVPWHGEEGLVLVRYELKLLGKVA